MQTVRRHFPRRLQIECCNVFKGDEDQHASASLDPTHAQKNKHIWNFVSGKNASESTWNAGPITKRFDAWGKKESRLLAHHVLSEE